MIIKKKRRTKPLYKQFIRLKKNVQNRTKLLKFKKKKWKIFIEQYIRSLKRFNKFKAKDQTNYVVTKYSSRNTSYKKQFKQSLINRKRLKLFYGNISTKLLKKYKNYIFKKKNCNINNSFIKLFEQRLDTIIFKSKFSKSFKDAQQLIAHGKVLVNNNVVKISSYKLKPGDFISINNKFINLTENNIKYCLKNNIKNNTGLWPLPPKHLTINYKTMQIVVGNIEFTNFETEFSFNLNLEKILFNKYFY